MRALKIAAITFMLICVIMNIFIDMHYSVLFYGMCYLILDSFDKK